MKTHTNIRLGLGALYMGMKPTKENLIGFVNQRKVRHRQICKGCGRKNVNTYSAGFVWLCRRCWEGKA